MDDKSIELAESRMQMELEAGIAAAARKPREVESTGACHECGEELPGGRRFCDRDCLDTWQLRRDAQVRAGRLL